MAFVVSACSFGLSSPPPATYDLRAPVVSKTRGTLPIQLTVNAPSAVRIVDTEEVLVKGADGRISYVSGIAWGDRLPRLFQARLVDTLANSGRYRAVLTNQDRVTGDYSLSVEIRDFEIESTPHGFEAVVDVYVKLIDEHESKVLTTKSFQERAKAAGDEVSAGLPVLNDVFQKVALDIMTWVSARTSARA
jgi:cholesterol transport system auxiliary component